jgi:hypothetical protein
MVRRAALSIISSLQWAGTVIGRSTESQDSILCCEVQTLDRHRLVSTSAADYPLHVVAPTGLPDIPLTLFANELCKSLSRSSVPLYVREVLSLVDWARRDPVTIANGWSLFGEPRAVRNILREYLRVAAKCKVTVHPGRFRATPVCINATAETAIQVRVLLAALKRLYEALSAAGLYAHANPLAHEDAAQIASKLYELRYQAMLAAEGRGPMPVSSGVDSPTEIRCPENYFRFVDQQWVPSWASHHARRLPRGWWRRGYSAGSKSACHVVTHPKKYRTLPQKTP